MGTQEPSLERRSVCAAALARLWPHFSLRDWTVVIAMAVWMWLNVLDLMITYTGLAAGTAYEANRALAGIIRRPLVAIPVKMSLAYLLLKLVRRLEERRPGAGLAPLLAANTWLSWACVHNLHVASGSHDWTGFSHFFPLAGPPA
jgi:Domain of unknown function (DUF5658)